MNPRDFAVLSELPPLGCQEFRYEEVELPLHPHLTISSPRPVPE